MAADFTIIETELSNLRSRLKRELHMRNVGKLARKHLELGKNVIQRKQIQNLTKQVDELYPTVCRLYSAHHALKDNEIKGYLIYLLNMKDYFGREVTTKQEMIQRRVDQIKMLFAKLCVMKNEYVKKKKAALPVAPEFVRLENISLRMNQIEKRISTLRQENKEIKENIGNMRIFQRQYRKFELDFRSKIKDMKERAQQHLDRAVTAYEEREEFLSKGKVLQERCAQDIRKAAINENALILCLEKAEKNEIFGKLQETIRMDVRLATTSDMIEKGVTGLEPTLQSVRDLHSAMSEATGQGSAQGMEDHFKLIEDQTASMFSYVDEMLKEMNHLQGIIDELRIKNRDLLKSMTTSERRMRWEIKVQQDQVQESAQEARVAAESKNEAKTELDVLVECVRSIYSKCCPEKASELQDTPIDDTNVIDYLQKAEQHILEYLLFIEYLRAKETSDEDGLAMPLVSDQETPLADEPREKDPLDAIQPRILESECELPCLMEMDREKSFLEFEQLKKRAVKVVADIESGESTDEDRGSSDSIGKKR